MSDDKALDYVADVLSGRLSEGGPYGVAAEVLEATRPIIEADLLRRYAGYADHAGERATARWLRSAADRRTESE